MENRWNNGFVDESPNAKRIHQFIHLWESFERMVHELDSSMDEILGSYGKQEAEIHLQLDYKISMKIEELSERGRRLVQHCTKDKARFVESKLKIRDEKWNYLRTIIEDRAKYFLERDKDREDKTWSKLQQRKMVKDTDSSYTERRPNESKASKFQTSPGNPDKYMFLPPGPIMSTTGNGVDGMKEKYCSNVHESVRNGSYVKRRQRNSNNFLESSIASADAPKSTRQFDDVDGDLESQKKENKVPSKQGEKMTHPRRQNANNSVSTTPPRFLETNLDEHMIFVADREGPGSEDHTSRKEKGDLNEQIIEQKDSQPDSVIANKIIGLESDRTLQNVLNYQADDKLEETVVKQVDDEGEESIEECTESKEPKHGEDGGVVSLPMSDIGPLSPNGNHAVNNNSLEGDREDSGSNNKTLDDQLSAIRYIDEDPRDHNQNVVIGIEKNKDGDSESSTNSTERDSTVQGLEVTDNLQDTKPRKVSVLIPKGHRHDSKRRPSKKGQKKRDKTAWKRGNQRGGKQISEMAG